MPHDQCVGEHMYQCLSACVGEHMELSQILHEKKGLEYQIEG